MQKGTVCTKPVGHPCIASVQEEFQIVPWPIDGVTVFSELLVYSVLCGHGVILPARLEVTPHQSDIPETPHDACDVHGIGVSASSDLLYCTTPKSSYAKPPGNCQNRENIAILCKYSWERASVACSAQPACQPHERELGISGHLRSVQARS